MCNLKYRRSSSIDRLTNFVSYISHGKIQLSKGSIVKFMKGLNNESKYLIENMKNELLNSELMYTDGTV